MEHVNASQDFIKMDSIAYIPAETGKLMESNAMTGIGRMEMGVLLIVLSNSVIIA
jgi:hypothetical protein